MEKQGLARKCLLQAGPSKHIEPDMELTTEAPSHPQLNRMFLELHSGKVDSPRGTNHSPNASLLMKAKLAWLLT